MLLFITDVVFGARNHASTLDALNSLCDEDPGQDWVRTKCANYYRQQDKRMFDVQAHLKPSQFRPPSGERPRGPATGPNCTSDPFI